MVRIKLQYRWVSSSLNVSIQTAVGIVPDGVPTFKSMRGNAGTGTAGENSLQRLSQPAGGHIRFQFVGFSPGLSGGEEIGQGAGCGHAVWREGWQL